MPPWFTLVVQGIIYSGNNNISRTLFVYSPLYTDMTSCNSAIKVDRIQTSSSHIIYFWVSIFCIFILFSNSLHFKLNMKGRIQGNSIQIMCEDKTQFSLVQFSRRLIMKIYIIMVNGSFSVHSLNEHYLSIQQFTGSCQKPLSGTHGISFVDVTNLSSTPMNLNINLSKLI